MTPPTSGSDNDVLTMPKCGFVFWWLFIVSVHLISVVFTFSYAYFYWKFDSTILSFTLGVYEAGVSQDRSRIIACVHIFLAAVHSISILLMVGSSLWRRSLSFYPWSITTPLKINKESHQSVRGDRSVVENESPSMPTAGTSTFQRANIIYDKVASRHGLFGVNGQYFYVILICREIIETSFQTVQAFRMSKYSSDSMLNHFYVSLLVVNCWSSVIVSTRLFGKDEARRRFAAIVCDCFLDLTSAMGVSVIIALQYVNAYDVEMKGFRIEFLENDEWVSKMLNDAQMVMVTSWSDLVARVIFFLGVVTTTTSLKKLLRRTPASTNLTGSDGNQGRSRNCSREASVVPMPENTGNEPPPLATHHFRYKEISLSGRVRCTLLWFVHIFFIVWGLVILTLHLHALLKTPLIACNPKVHPFFGSLPACFTVEFNCHKLGISGMKSEIQTEWSKFDPSTVVNLYISHCPDLEIPDTFQSFRRVSNILIYNSTISEWSTSAAVTNSFHLKLGSISLVRVNMTGGLLPLGLQSQSFPMDLFHICLCETNLGILPDDLYTKWNIGSLIYIENSKLVSLPDALVRLKPSVLSLAGNPLTAVSSELINPSEIPFIFLRRTKLSQLPEHVTYSINRIGYLDVSDTDIGFFWSWIDPFLEITLEPLPQIAAGGSPYCADLGNIMRGLLTEFSVPFQPGHSPILMNASEANWERLRQHVDCYQTLPPTLTPLEDVDSKYGMTTCSDD